MRLIPDSGRGMLLRFGLGALLVVVLVAATTAVAGLLQFKQLASYIGLEPSLSGVQVQIPAPGDPQTLLLIGSDHRAGDPYRAANTDTMMLMRINADSTTINVLSIPRDLKVQIPQGATTYSGRLNSAYSVGGPNLLLHILKTQVFPGFHVNHVIDVNFRAFSDLIDAIGCVYTDVDHRYYNISAPGPDNYSSIDIGAGYQKLCGAHQSLKGALAFVRFRHTDSDIVRNARQQDFLRWARDAYSGGELFANRDKLLRIFGSHAQTDYTLHSADALENLVVLLATSAGHQLKSIPFPAQLSTCNSGGQTPCYVTADPAREQQTYQQFVTPTLAPPTPASAGPGPPGGAVHGGPGRHRGAISTAGLVPDPLDGRAQAADLHRAGLPVYYPNLVQAGSQYCSSIAGNCNGYLEPPSEYVGAYPREYRIHAGGRAYPSYRMTLVINSALGLYYGVQGTTWRNPPILAKPTQTQTIGGRQLLEYFNGRKLSLVAWRTPSGAYWVANSLTDSIPSKQLIAIAASLKLQR